MQPSFSSLRERGLSFTFFIAVLCLLLKLSLNAAAPGWEWVKIAGGSPVAYSLSLELSGDNRIFLGSSATTPVMGGLQSPGHIIHVLGGFTANGQFIFSRAVTSAELAGPNPAMIAATSGEGILYAAVNSTKHLEVVKYSRDGNRNDLTSRPRPGISSSYESGFFSISSDQAGSFVLAGGLNFLTNGNQTLSSYGGANDLDAFLVKCDSQGNLLWARRAGAENHEMGFATAIDENEGAVYSAGSFYSDQIAFGLTVLPRAANEAPFLAKYSASGDVLWAVRPNLLGLARIVSLDCAADGSVVFSGVSQQQSDEGTQTAFIGKYTSAGTREWVKTVGTTWKGRFPRSLPVVKVDRTGQVYFAATFKDSIAIGGKSYSSAGQQDIVLAQFTPAGDPVWVKTAGFIGDDRATDLAIDKQGRVYLSGTVAHSALFDNTLVEGSHLHSFFIAKLQDSLSLLPTISSQPSSRNSAVGEAVTLRVEVSSPSPTTYQWFKNNAAIPGATAAELNFPSLTPDSAGAYFVEIRNEAGTIRSSVAQLVVKGQLPVTVTTIAGNGTPGYVDSSDPSQVRFNEPNGLAYYNQFFVAVADGANHLIRLMDSSGVTGSYVGQNSAGSQDGPASVARFNFPLGIATANTLDLFVADFGNNRVRRVSPFGFRAVSTVAGSASGYRDGAANTSLFASPNDLVLDAAGNIYLTEFGNHTIRVIRTSGQVQTVAGNGTPGYQDGQGTAARFNQPGGLVMDASGNIFVTEYGGHRIRRISPAGLVSTIAGTNSTGFVDGQGKAARFHTPDGITIDRHGNLYVTDQGNHAIRKIDPQGNVTTVAGLGASGFANGNAATASFKSPGGILWHPAGELWVSDTGNHAIRRIRWSEPASAGAELLLTLNPMLTIFGEAGARYRIEAAEATAPLDWTLLDVVTLQGPADVWFDTQPATRTLRYYRAVKIP